MRRQFPLCVLLAMASFTSLAFMGPETIRITAENSNEFGFVIVREYGGTPDEVTIEVTGPMKDHHGCELRNVGTATLDAEDTQVSVFLSHSLPSGGAPKVLFSPNVKQGFHQTAWFQYGCENGAYRYEIME